MSDNLAALRRRSVLAGGVGAAALAPLVDAASANVEERSRRKMFRHGVASGDPLPRAVVLWTRVTPTDEATPGSRKGPDVEVTWEVAKDQRFRHVVRSGRVVTGKHRDHTVKVDARGLQPGRWYYYRFLADGAKSPVGRTRTAPKLSADVSRLRVGVVSCSNWEQGYFAAYRHLAGHPELDAVIHLGDYIYEGGRGGRPPRQHEPAHEIRLLDDYRERHGQYKTDPDLQRVHASVPFIVTWDDHEVTNNNWRRGGQNHDASEGDFHARKVHAHHAYDEWMPVRMSGTADLGDGTSLFRSLRWGRLADIAMLDLRSYRDEQVHQGEGAAPEPNPEVDDPRRTITGNRQMAWLKRVLLGRETRWKLLGNSVMIAPLSLAQLPKDAVKAIDVMTGGHMTSDGVSLNFDQWDGYTADRIELFDHIVKNKVKNAVFLTGDVHSAWASDLPADAGSYPATGSVGVEFVCTSITSNNLDDVNHTPPRSAVSLSWEAALQGNNRHVKYLNFDDHGYSVLDVTKARAQMDYYVLADKRRADTAAHHGASWFTRSGSGRVEPAAGPLS